jgi:predicted Fe-Mo cluster-binding NifX family protein
MPKWLGERNANTIIADGMGQRAQNLFIEQNIEVVVGAPAEDPETLAKAYMVGTLESGVNACDH